MISIDSLPGEVLLEVFDFYVDQTRGGDGKKEIEGWQPLVQVCRRWRSIVFGSPRHLNLRLVYTHNTRAMDPVDIWPALPLEIQSRGFDTDNIVALLGRSDLVRRISRIELLDFSIWELEHVWEAMQVLFPELTHLHLHRHDETVPLRPLSDSFLGGSVPRLRYLKLNRIPYPGLPKLLSSATHLTDLHLKHIPDSGYIQPEAMVDCLSTLTSLERLSLRFARPLPDQESQRPSPWICASLPVLDKFTFQGAREYLEVLVAHIDAPRLRDLETIFFNDILFITSQFTRFISRTPTFEAFDKASVDLRAPYTSIILSSSYARLCIRISKLDWELSFLEQVCTSSLPPISTVHELYMMSGTWPQWLGPLRSFSAVKNLYLFKELAPCVVPALQDLVGGRTTKEEAFPTLENIFLEELQESGPVQEGIDIYRAACRTVTAYGRTFTAYSRTFTAVFCGGPAIPVLPVLPVL